VKDQYVGDVNDFLKYAFLRTLQRPGRRIAVVWMLTAGDDRSDGRRLGYLSQPSTFRAVDPPLYDLLLGLVEEETRSVQAVEARGILPGALFVPHLLDDSLVARTAYMARALEIAQGAQLIFFDPDNGLDVRSVAKGRVNSSKYLFRDEVGVAYEQGSSVAIYQHFPRVQRVPFLQRLAEGFSAGFGYEGMLAIVTPHVAFLVVPQPRDRAKIETLLEEFTHRARPTRAALLRLT
jgi:hypothetical protein